MLILGHLLNLWVRVPLSIARKKNSFCGGGGCMVIVFLTLFFLLRWDFFCCSHLFNLGVHCLCLVNSFRITALQNRYLLDCNRCPWNLEMGNELDSPCLGTGDPCFRWVQTLAESSSFLFPTSNVKPWTANPAHYSCFLALFRVQHRMASCLPAVKGKEIRS